MAFRVYKASAGSGKTYTLVLMYLLLVLDKPEKFRRILAVTFTNKAANEMKARIVKALGHLVESEMHANGNKDPLLQQLIDTLKLSEADIRLRAQQVLTAIIHNYSDFSIGTIDSFVHRLVRTFSRDLHLPYQFEVELENEVIVRLSVDMLLEEVGINPFITKQLIGFLLQRLEAEKSWRIENELATFAHNLLKEESFAYIRELKEIDEEVLSHAGEQIRERLGQIENHFAKMASEALAVIHEQQLEVDHFAYKKNGVYGLFFKLSRKRILDANATSYVTKPLETGNWASGEGKKDKDVLARLQAIVPRLEEMLKNILQQLEVEKPKYTLLQELNTSMYSLSVFAAIQQNIDAIRHAESRVHISEFNKRVAMLLQEAAVPYIYERLGERYQHYLIDEFQDTSVLQWHNFLPLIDNALANKHLNLVVGDAKQAIYRFRSGEVEQFMMLPSLFRKENNPYLQAFEQSLTAHYQPKELPYNYRSDGVIVQFNNRFFSFAKEKLDEHYRQAFEGHQQQSVKADDTGYVELRFIPAQPNQELMQEHYCEQVHELVLQQLGDGFQARDIAVLVRKGEQGNLLARHLSKHGIGVVSAEALLLASSVRIRLIINLIRMLQTEYDPITITQCVHDMGMLLDMEGETWNVRLQKVLAMPPAQQFGALQSFMQQFGISFNPDQLRTLSLYDMSESLVRQLGFDQQADPYVQFFLETVHHFQVKERGSADAFLHYWAGHKSKLSVTIPESTNSIRVLTVHKAKGLEFPVVIYPFANDNDSRNTAAHFWFHLHEDEIQGLPVGIVPVRASLQNTRLNPLYQAERAKTRLDNLNLLYVALTRATKRLYTLSDFPEKKKAFSFPILFREYLESIGQLDHEQMVYTFGKKEDASYEDIKAEKPQTDETARFVSTDWTKRLRIAPDPVIQWMESEKGSALYWGRLVHQLMAEIGHAGQAGQVLQKYLEDGTLTISGHQQLKVSLQAIFSHEKLRACFQPHARVMTERELITAEGKVYRPDRYIILDDRAVLIDYKTGKPEAEHLDQLRTYVDAIGKLEMKPLSAFLVYINDNIEVVDCV